MKDVFVHLDPSDGCADRLASAIALAQRFGARLTGYYVVGPNPLPMYAGDPMGGATLAAAHMDAGEAANPYLQALERVQSDFEAAVADASVEARWQRVDGPLALALSSGTRAADLIVAGSNAPADELGLTPSGLAAEVALHAGRPVLVVPKGERWDRIASRVLVAWNGSKEAARAVHDAMPFLVESEQVTVATVGEEPEPLAPASALVEHLAVHGIDAERLALDTDGDVGDELLERAAELGCDLVVMGAYGHSRLRELVFGGVTRRILKQPSMPILLSH